MLLGAMLVLIGAGAAYGGTRLEENDRFCATCHLAAERTYYNRAQMALDQQEPVDLASYHYRITWDDPQIDDFRCIDCHRGRQTIWQRAATLGIGIYDALIYLTGGGDSAAVEAGKLKRTTSLVEESCIACHAAELVTLGFNNHYHNYLPAAEKAFDWTGNLSVEAGTEFDQERALLLNGVQAKETTVTCFACHQAHVTVVGGHRVQFIQGEAMNQSCTCCHLDNDLEIDLISES